jgi:hypothetical protein
MFGYFKRKRHLEAMKHGLNATSKSSLKLQCLFAAKGDLAEAKELYDFFASDLDNLPDHDPLPTTWVDNTKDAVNGLMSWFKENQDTLAQGIDFVRGILNRGGTAGAAENVPSLPPINDE